jgi:gluconate 5-dehydrogenase|tara:strand:+ start:567 stop:1352 length:786 start_codon:yes stop_codon:yes gene_type:complete
MKNSSNFLHDIFGLENKTILLTGAVGQLGRVISKGFLDVGAKVIATDLTLDNTKLINHKNISYLSMDLTSKKSVNIFFEDIKSNHSQIDILINNAGVSTFEPFEERTEESFDWVSDVNLKGTFLCIQEYFKHQENYKYGNIINIASIYGLISPDPRIYIDSDRKNSEVYGATKAGIIQMTKYFAVHLAQNGIRVNSISPGGIYNPENPQSEHFINEYSKRNPMNRMANSEEILGAVLYLASDASSYVTGHNLVVDGGMSCW